MDLEDQASILQVAEKYPKESLVVLLGAASADNAAIALETVIAGDPSYAGPLAGIQLKLPVYHILEPEVKAEVDPAVYQEQVGIMETVIDSGDILNEVRTMRDQAGSA